MKVEIRKKIKINYSITLLLYFLMCLTTMGAYSVTNYCVEWWQRGFEEDKMDLAVCVGAATIIVLFLYRIMDETKSRKRIVVEIIANIIYCACAVMGINRGVYIIKRLDFKFNQYPIIIMIFGIIILVVTIVLGLVNVVLHIKGLVAFEYSGDKDVLGKNYLIEYTRGKIESAFTVGIVIYACIVMFGALVTGFFTDTEPGFSPDHAFIKVLLSSILPLLVFFFGIARTWISIGNTKKMIISAIIITIDVYNIWFNSTIYYFGAAYGFVGLTGVFIIGALFVVYFMVTMLFTIRCGLLSKKEEKRKCK